MRDLPTYRSKLVTFGPLFRGGNGINMERDMQLERSHIVGVRLMTLQTLAKVVDASRLEALPTFAQTALLRVQFADRFEDIVYEDGPVRPFVAFPTAVKRELYRPVSWRGVNLKSSTMWNLHAEMLTIAWEFTYIEDGDTA